MLKISVFVPSSLPDNNRWMINRASARFLGRCLSQAYRTSSAGRFENVWLCNSFLSLRPSAPPTFSFPRIQHRSIMGTTIDRTAEEAKTLLSALQQKFPSKSLGEDRWYILAVCFFSSSIGLYFASKAQGNKQMEKKDGFVILILVFIPSSSPSSPPANAITRPPCTPT